MYGARPDTRTLRQERQRLRRGSCASPNFPQRLQQSPRVPSEGPHWARGAVRSPLPSRSPPAASREEANNPKSPSKASPQGTCACRCAPALQVKLRQDFLSLRDQPSKDKPKVKAERAAPRRRQPGAQASGYPPPAAGRSTAMAPEERPEEPQRQRTRAPNTLRSFPDPEPGPCPPVAPAPRTKRLQAGRGGPGGPPQTNPRCLSRDTKLLSPLKDAPPPQSLVVKITLDLLSRIPQPPGRAWRPRNQKTNSTAGKARS